MSPTAKVVVASLDVKVRESAASLEVPPSDTSAAVIAIVGPVSSCVHANWVAAELVLLYASLKPPAATSMVVAPSAVAVNVAVYTVAEVDAKLLNDPPDTDMSPTAKSVVASLDVNVKVSAASLVVEPLDTALPPATAVIVMVGLVSSCVHVNWVAAAFAAPAASVYPPAPTSMVVAPSAVGVKVAV